MKILVAEGNVAEVRKKTKELCGLTPGEGYADVIKSIVDGTECDIFCPADTDDRPPRPLKQYDGIVITGSALNAYQDIPAVRRQVDLCKEIYDCGVPFFGSCWGLQVATVAAGGRVEKNHRGREVAYARSVSLTAAGRDHPMHRGRPQTFDAPAVHSDHVTILPNNAVITAFNSMSEVQALEIRRGNGVFWGVQYHPEFSLLDVATVIRRYGSVLVDDEAIFSDMRDLEKYASRLSELHNDPTRRDISWQYGLGPDLVQSKWRNLEIANWLKYCEAGMA